MKTLVLLALVGCAQGPSDIYPFPVGKDGMCPTLGELPGLRPDPDLGCVAPCTEVSSDGCTMTDGTTFGGSPLSCLASAIEDGDPLVCVRTCSSNEDCGPLYRCASVARPSGLTICRL